MDKNRYNNTVSIADNGQRLDKYLSEQTEGISRTRIKSLIENGKIYINNHKITEPAYRVKSKQCIIFELPVIPAIAKPVPQKIELDIVFEDKYLIIVNKPSGLVVHPGPGNPDGTLVNALIAHCGSSLSGIGGERRPGIVHRLDKETSGLIVAAKNDIAHRGLANLFEKRDLKRIYCAIIWGTIKPLNGRVIKNIGRSKINRKKMAVVDSGGKYAETNYQTVKKLSPFPLSIIECQLKTGRTHQIRVHMSHLGHSIVGDKVYGGKQRKKEKINAVDLSNAIQILDRQALHAKSLSFKHPITGKQISIETKLPSDMENFLSLVKSAPNKKTPCNSR